jgi:7-carboxy-7-deazaguanine synthase
MNLLVKEIFRSIQGETTRTGFPSLFIRVAGCNLNCIYCDTKYARSGGASMDLSLILKRIKEFDYFDHITITGGEPLCQKNIIPFMDLLIKEDYNVQVETNGSIDLSGVADKIRKIIDVKTPSSNEAESFNIKNLNYLNSRDEIKFVIFDEDDFYFSKNFIEKYLEKFSGVINFSPGFNHLSYFNMADMILRNNLPVRLNLQLHKIAGLETEAEKNW